MHLVMLWSRIKDVVSPKYRNDAKQIYKSKLLHKHVRALYKRNCLSRLSLMYRHKLRNKIVYSQLKHFTIANTKTQLEEKLMNEFEVLLAKCNGNPIKRVHFKYHIIPRRVKANKEHKSDDMIDLMTKLNI